MKTACVQLFVLIALFGCDDASDDGGDAAGGDAAGGGGFGGVGGFGGMGGVMELPPSDPFDPATLAARLAPAICDQQQACRPILAAYLPQTPAECVAAITTRLTTEYTAIEPLIAARRLAFRQAGFNRCLDAYTAATARCEIGVDPRTCADIFIGGQEEGRGCSAAFECAEGLACEREDTASCGTCRRRAALGEPCDEAICVIGAECIALAEGAVCVPVTQPVGAACFTPETGLCIGELQCAGPAELTCQVGARLNEPCDPAVLDCNLQAGFLCGPAGTCVEVTIGTEGSPCGPETTTLCRSDFFCETATFTCKPLPRVGQVCPGNLCAAGAICGNATCQPQAAGGEACASTDQCTAPDVCLDGVCGPLRFPIDCAP